MLSNNFKDLFDFNSTERRGSIVLVLLSLLILMVPKIYSFFDHTEIDQIGTFSMDIKAFQDGLKEDSVKNRAPDNENFSNPIQENEGLTTTLFPFDPNGLADEKWLKLGLKAWQIKVIKNYESKGGKFYNKNDLKKIYGIDQNLYTKLEPYIVIPQKQNTRQESHYEKQVVTAKRQVIDINVADTTLLMELKGIGPAFARRIVKYREKLGGFYSVDQLLEVFGFDQQRLDMLKEQCSIGNGPYRMIPINKVSVQDLKYHPYLTYETAKILVDSRIQKGGFKSIQDIRGISGFSDELFRKITPYFNYQN